MTLPLTQPNPTLAAQARNTWAGMSHWAGSGPNGATCRLCTHWTGCGDLVGNHTLFGTPKPRRCAKYQQMMNGAKGGKVPHDARACKYFEPINRASQQPLQGPCQQADMLSTTKA
jgi:hypothetical protein